MDELSHELSPIDLFRLSLRIFKTKPIRTILTIFGMAVGIGAVMFLVSLGYGLQFILIGKLVTTEDSLMTLEAAYPAETTISIDKSKLEEILQVPGAQEVSPIAEFPAEIKINGSTGLVLARVVNPNYFRLSGILPEIGSIIREDSPDVVVSNQAAKLINLKIDKSELGRPVDFKVFFQIEQSAQIEEVALTHSLNLNGIIVDDTQPPFAYIPSKYLSKETPFYKSVLVKAQDINSVEGVRDKLIEKGFIISAKIDLVNQAKKVMNIITIVLGVFGIVALFVSAIGMFNTMIVGFLERIYEVGIMKSLGATDRDVRNLFLMESFLMGFLGGSGGVLFGWGGGKAANLGLSALSQHLGGKAIILFLTPAWFIITTLILSSFIGIAAGFWPAYRASYLSPKEAFKNR
ncbi:MAG: ABC transporter permease [Patescibacteria group bacterium]|nr:ABC transporter permease [Patescibacteria group bacterium]